MTTAQFDRLKVAKTAKDLGLTIDAEAKVFDITGLLASILKFYGV